MLATEHILVDIRLPSKGDGDPAKKNVIDSPFESLDVVETDETITIRTTPPNPASEVKKEQSEAPMQPDPKMEKMMRDALKDLRVAFRIPHLFIVSPPRHSLQSSTKGTHPFIFAKGTHPSTNMNGCVPFDMMAPPLRNRAWSSTTSS